VLLASEPAFLALELGGAAYLLLLGAQALRRVFRGSGAPEPVAAPSGRRLAPAVAFPAGAGQNL
jgi:threonine/homoserine/homoserine lactone efflux protein